MDKKNLLWLDLEMTGLNPEQDVILELAAVVTDNELNLIARGPSLVIYQSAQQLAIMVPFVKQLHTKSGLLTEVAASQVTLQEAEQALYDFVVAHCEKDGTLLAGNSVWQDRNFLAKYMPRIIEYLHYRVLDVSGIKEVIRRWYPESSFINFKKADNHRAYEDVMASIDELKHYREHFFVRQAKGEKNNTL